MKQVGGFGGIDSSYLTSCNVPRRCDELSCRRDALSIQGRPDIRAQMNDRSLDIESPIYMPPEVIQRVIEYSELQYPDPLSLAERKTSTYIPCETAIKLQEIMYGESSRSLKVYDNDNDQTYSQKLFVPPWPTHFVEVHPMNDHGQRMFRVIHEQFGLWQLLCITGRVTDVWEALSNSVDNNKAWQGHWLRFASNVLGLKGQASSSRFFNAKRNIVTIFSSPLEEILSSKEKTAELFSPCKEIVTIEADSSLDELENAKIVICVHPIKPPETLRLFELRCLLCAEVDEEGNNVQRSGWKMFVRHRGKKFWVQNGLQHPFKYDGTCLGDEAWEGARIAVFCRRDNGSAVSLQRRYLNAIGGQSSVFCTYHKCPLVLNHRAKRNINNLYPCVCLKDEEMIETEAKCSRFSTYICPESNLFCKTAICEHHLRDAKRNCLTDGPETVMFLGEEDALYCRYTSNEDGCFRGSFPPEMQGVPPEALGPTAAHELPQDMVDNEYESEDEISENGSLVLVTRPINNDTDDDDDSFVSRLDDETEDTEDLLLSSDWINLDSDDDSELPAGYNVIDQFDITGTSTSDDINHFDTTHIPTTTTGTDQREISVDHRDPSGVSIPLCVLLNQQGHLLTRTNHKLRMNKMHRSICERLVAKSTSRVVPLVYAEGQLFPTIFWYSLEDGSIPGAMPTALWTDKQTLAKLGIASMREHAKMRVTNPAIPTSTDPSYHFMMLDQLTNLGANGKHTKMVLQRGFADHQHKDGVSFRDKSDSAELYGESSENHANVHKLSALVQERRPHFFFTQTCNQKTCRGLKVLREWVTSDSAIRHIQEVYGLQDLSEASNYLRESAAPYVSRSWNEVADMWMRYIIYSPEKPIGKIDYAWFRKEFQGEYHQRCKAIWQVFTVLTVLFLVCLFSFRHRRQSLSHTCNPSDHP